MNLERLPNGPFDIIGRGHRLQAAAAKLVGRPTSAMRTRYEVDGKPVIFLHTPQTGGTSLGKALGVKRRRHATPEERLSERWWLATYSVVAVREPYQRFRSSYWSTVDPDKPVNGLVKKYGPVIKSLTPFEFLELLAEEPSFGGSQLRFTSFPSAKKPMADLILRFEEIKDWSRQLFEAGVVPEDFTIPHFNAKKKRPKGDAEVLGIDGDALDDLKRKVVAFFAEDYEVLGYTPPVT